MKKKSWAIGYYRGANAWLIQPINGKDRVE